MNLISDARAVDQNDQLPGLSLFKGFNRQEIAHQQDFGIL